MSLFEQILEARGLTADGVAAFLSPDYTKKHDPFLLPDMGKAVERLAQALQNQEHITIYGDYDIDGLTATTVLIDAFESFGFKHVNAFIPNRFVEGYGLTVDAVEQIIADGAQLIVTVDCGSLSHKEIEHSNKLGVDVIVTDHHNVSDIQPSAVAVVNPKRKDHTYPFIDLAGVGVAFKLVQALQTRLTGLPIGHEKWLLDLVALGTVCDVVTLVDENRTNVYWGLQVLRKTRRPGLKALMAVARVEPASLNSRSLGVGLGPRMNAAGRVIRWTCCSLPKMRLLLKRLNNLMK
jgi:single-stranded-DNA-specific exonuclease